MIIINIAEFTRFDVSDTGGTRVTDFRERSTTPTTVQPAACERLQTFALQTSAHNIMSASNSISLKSKIGTPPIFFHV